jgi:hypothetical protein
MITAGFFRAAKAVQAIGDYEAGRRQVSLCPLDDLRFAKKP